MSTVIDTPQVVLHHGDCIDVMSAMPDASVDAVVTDPPYGLEFMGRDWDGADGFRRSLDAADAGRESVFGRASRTSPEYRAGALFQEWCEAWACEALRVLKPGGHMLAFGGTRTWHRLAVAVEDAGFEIRDSIAWMYGGGFPKSLDVSKAIDAAGGVSPADSARVLKEARERAGLSRAQLAEVVGCTLKSVVDWEDGRLRSMTDAAPEHLVPSPAYRAKLADALGYTSDERIVAGIDPRPIGYGGSAGGGRSFAAASTDAARAWQGWGTALKPAFEPIVVARKPLAGTVAANVLAYGTGALNIDASRIPATDAQLAAKYASVQGAGSRANSVHGADVRSREGSAPHDAGRFPTNVLLDDTQADVLDRQELGASRFFYTAKANSAERPVVDGVAHPTVKPLDLMRYLVRLVTPKGGVVLEPFAGSGTTLEAAVLEGFRAIGIEREATYIPLIEKRLDKPHEVGLDLFGGAA